MRRQMLVRAGMVLLALGGVLVALVCLLRHEPQFYARKEIPPGKLRADLARECQQQFSTVYNGFNSDGDSWQATLTEAQINSYFQDQFVQSGLAATVLPADVRAPRLAIEDDVIRLGFRYGEEPWSAVVSVDFRVWQAREPNVVAIQLLSLRVGSIPVTTKVLMDQLAAFVNNKDIELTWYRHEGYLTALLRLNASRQRATSQLKQLVVGQSKIIIAGQSANPLPAQIKPPPSGEPLVKPAANN